MVHLTATGSPAAEIVTPTSEGGSPFNVMDPSRLSKRIARLEADLIECREFLEDQADVRDGSYGEPRPNRAMQLVSMIDETLDGASR